MGVSKETKIQVQILSLLNEIPEPAKRIEVIERIGKRLRQANSIESAKEVEKFARKAGTKKAIDDYATIQKVK